MSGFAGIYHLDGRPVDRELLQRMSGAIAHRGKDDSGMWFNGPIGMAHRMFHTTPESLFEKQPLMDEENQLCLVLDGRVDNRDELKSALASRGFRLRSDTDAEIVLRAYEAWGEDCAAGIIGDFAFVIWDERRKWIYCARDFIGYKPLFYYFNGKSFWWASEFHSLFEDDEVRQELNEGMVGEYLSGLIRTPDETLYQGILRLLPAHCLIVDSSGVRHRRYWDLDPSKAVGHASDEEYAEHFREIFREAVRCRMRGIGPVGADLSGGLDSSSVVCMAQSLLQDGKADCRGLETFSQVFAGEDCDESNYIRDVVEKWGLRSYQDYPPPAEAAAFAEIARRYKDFPGYAYSAVTDSLARAIAGRGVRICLTGEGGDEWFTGSENYCLDLLLDLKVSQSLCAASRTGFLRGVRPLTRQLLRVCVWPRIPRCAQSAARWVLRRPLTPWWIAPEFARRISLADRLDQGAYTPPDATLSQQDLYSPLTDAWNAHCIDLDERNEVWSGMEKRHPLNDRRIVEFGLALPDGQRSRNGVSKFVLRRAMSKLLPETVIVRQDKADFTGQSVKQFQRWGGRHTFDSMEIYRAGWLKPDKVNYLYSLMSKASEQGFNGPATYVWQLWMIWGIDLFCRETSILRGISNRSAIQTEQFQSKVSLEGSNT